MHFENHGMRINPLLSLPQTLVFFQRSRNENYINRTSNKDTSFDVLINIV